MRTLKTYSFILSFLFLPFCIQAQEPVPELYQTWYLSEVLYASGVYWDVAYMEEDISPFMTISENLEFTGGGACNAFSGQYELSPTLEYQAIEFNVTAEDCGTPLLNSFESDYFGFISDWWNYEIIDDSEGQKLILMQPLDPFAVFQNYPLSTATHQAPSIRIYPIPTKETLYISSPQQPILRASYYNYSGQLLGSQTGPVEALDISQLATGVYLLQLETEEGTSVHKFVKN